MKKNWSEEQQSVQNKEQQSVRNKECVEFFRSQSVFHRLLCGFREKYRSYGSFSGTVTLRNLKKEEIEELEGFFQRSFHGQKSVTVSAARFERALKNSRFEMVEPVELLEMYFQEKMLGKKEEKQRKEQQWEEIFAKIRETYEKTPAAEWLSSASSCKDEGTLVLGAKIINAFPCREERKEYLAVFAARLTGNPHAFDEGTKEGQLLYQLVLWETENQTKKQAEKRTKTQAEKQVEDQTKGQMLFSALHKQRMYLEAGILKDDVSNYVMISGVRAWKKNGELHAGMEGFWREGDMVQVPLAVISDWKCVECPGQEIYIVENPSVYAMLCGKWKGKRACMCMNGQPRLSSLLLLDLLAAAGVKAYYAGDFDPEGLLIAQKLKQYYNGTFAYWQMTEQVYEKSRSAEKISERRRKALDKITDPELLPVASAIRAYGVAGYQENVLTILG